MSSRAIVLLLTGVVWSICSQHVQAQAPTPEDQQLEESVTSPTNDSEPTETLEFSDVTLLKPGDRMELTVIGFPELSGPQTVLADGSVQVPMAGSISVWGLTPAQVTSRIEQSLLPYVRRPQVGLTLLSIRPARVTVSGEVRRPGIYQIVQPDIPGTIDNSETGNVEGFQTISYALILAGGITPNADLRNVTIRRSQPALVSIANRTEETQVEFKINLWDIIQDGDLSSDIRIYDSDEIIVPTAPIVNNADQQALLDSTLAPVSITVQVGGEVRQPGTVQIRPSDGINAAIAAGGGPTDAARTRRVYLLRMMPDGQLVRESYHFGREDSGPLQDGDVVIVQRSNSRRILEFIGRILAPINTIEDFVN